VISGDRYEATIDNNADHQQLVTAVTAAITRDASVADALRTLLISSGRASSAVELLRLLPALAGRLATAIGLVIEGTPLRDLMPDEGLVRRVREFFLHPQETYSIDELSAVWEISEDDVCDIYSDELIEGERRHPRGPDGLRVAWADAVGATVFWTLFRPCEIEVALAEDFSRARSDRWRTVPILVRLPRFVLDLITTAPPFPDAAKTLPAKIEQFIVGAFRDEYQQRSTRRNSMEE
jgi:hypothetical protein